MRNLFLFLLLFAVANISAQQLNLEKAALSLIERMEAEPDAWHPVYILHTEQVDLKSIDAELTRQEASRSKRAETVITALQANAAATQGELLDFLRSNDETVKTETIKGYWVTNAVFAEVKADMVAELGRRNDVQWIEWDAPVELVSKGEMTAAPPVSPGAAEPGLKAIDAHLLWAMGYTGYGQSAFIVDTGVNPDHPALIAQSRNFYVPENEAWYPDVLGTGYEPFDCEVHGSHVAGTVLGLDRLNDDTIGVAFNAQWMGAPLIECVNGSTIAAFQWSLNPDGNATTSEDMPRVINNSWIGGAFDCSSLWFNTFETMEAAGVSVVFAAGNNGPGPSTIGTPGDVIVNEVNPFTVGAVNGNLNSFPIGGFSSRGPSNCPGDSALLIKPEVAAPGVSVRSSISGNDYASFQGTSMAAPHVSGAILLLGEAFPELSSFALKESLYLTCTDLGAPGEDNAYGQGIINVKEAFDYLVDQGHVPVSPYRANDIMMVDMRVPAFACEGQVAPVILAENAGTDTIYSFGIAYEVGSNTSLETWTGVLPPRGRVSVSLPPMDAPTGEQDVLVMVGQPNGVEDERPRNNNFRRTAIVTDREPFNAYAQGGASVCEGTSALLFGDSPYPDGELEVSWFDELDATEPVFTGVPFLTPPLTAPTSYFAEAKYVLGVGPADATIGEPKYRTPGDFQLGMRFEVRAPLTLRSVTVEAEETGGRSLVLEDADGEAVRTKVAILSEVGQNEIPLGWDLEPGDYTLFCTLGKPLMCNNSGAEYPYELGEFFSLRGTSTGGGNDDNVYYFYDWKIEIAEPCGRTPVLVEVGPAGDAPVASFSPSIDVFNIDENIPVQFENTSELGESFLWDFDDGTTSEEASPEHTFTAPGTYTVSLMATSADGCTDAAVHTIVVEESLISSADEVGGLESMDKVTVFPNPVREMLTVYVELASVQPVTLRLNDLSGRSVRTEKFANMQAGQLQLDVADLPEGVYFLLVETGAGRTAWKIVKT